MSRHRFFVAEPLPDTGASMLPLSAADVHHASAVLRVRSGEVTAVREPRVTLVFGVAKGSKNDDIVEGAVEIGVAEVWPALTARSVVKLDAHKRLERGERLRRVAVVVGPEGGLTAHEVATLTHAGAVACTGATILRAETAGVVATALVVHELGGLGHAL